MSVMPIVQTKRKLNNTELFLKLFHIQWKEIGINKYYRETTVHEKWQSEISPACTETRNAGTPERRNARTPERRNAGTPETRNVGILKPGTQNY